MSDREGAKSTQQQYGLTAPGAPRRIAMYFGGDDSNHFSADRVDTQEMKRLLIGISLAVSACNPAVRTAPTPEAYDLLITNARVVDGTGNPWYRGSVATRGDRIVYVGPSLPRMTAKRVIDVHEQVV